MTWVALLYMLLAMVLGAVLLRLGLRGRRIDDHPVCRQCRFDLIGQPQPLTTCPECGCGLRRPGWVRIGQRRRMPIVAGVGGLLLLLPALLIGSAVAVVATGSNLDKRTPTSLLLWQARHTSPSRLGAIADELEWRASGGKMKKEELARIAEVALDVQGDLSKPWSEKWGDLIEQAHTDDAIGKQQWQRFLDQAVVLAFKARPKVRQGDAIPVVATMKEARVGSGSQLMCMVAWDHLKVGGADAEEVDPESEHRSMVGALARRVFVSSKRSGAPIGQFMVTGSKPSMRWGQQVQTVSALIQVPTSVEPGTTTAHVEMRTVSKPYGYRVTWGDMRRTKEGSVRASDLSVEIIATGEPGAELVAPNADQRERMRQLLTPISVDVNEYDSGMGIMRNASTNFTITGRPMEFAFDVFCKAGDWELPWGTLVSGKSANRGHGQVWFGGNDELRMVYGEVPELKGTRVSIILRPNPARALETLDLTRVYGEEIVYEDVDVNISRSDMPRRTIRGSTESTPESKDSTKGLKTSTIDDAPTGEKKSDGKDDTSGSRPKE